jgi:ubiquinone/menaquinone biosynthesis C-methylase UbiE
MERIPSPELLDGDRGTAEVIAASLADLWFINRAFGGVSTAEHLISRVAKDGSLTRISLLEVASGSGEVPKAVRKRLQRRGITLDITFLDRSRKHLNGSRNSIAADALALPFRNGSFDLVSSTLFVHHLMPDALGQFVSEALRVCRVAVVINDLIRNPLHLALVYAGLPLFRSRITRHDAIASVRQAYTEQEMRTIVENTPAVRVDVSSHYLFRMGVIAWK